MLLSNIAVKFSTFVAGLSIFNNEMNKDQTTLHAQHQGTIDEFKADAGLMLSDILTIQPSASIFFSYARDTRVGELLKKDGADISVFAPTNKAVMALAHKPHEGPNPVDDGIIISEQEFDKRSRENVERWITAHIVPERLEKLEPNVDYETLLDGVTISVQAKTDSKDSPDWSKIVLNGNISVINKAEAANGVLYLLDGALFG